MLKVDSTGALCNSLYATALCLTISWKSKPSFPLNNPLISLTAGTSHPVYASLAVHTAISGNNLLSFVTVNLYDETAISILRAHCRLSHGICSAVCSVYIT